MHLCPIDAMMSSLLFRGHSTQGANLPTTVFNQPQLPSQPHSILNQRTDTSQTTYNALLNLNHTFNIPHRSQQNSIVERTFQ